MTFVDQDHILLSKPEPVDEVKLIYGYSKPVSNWSVLKATFKKQMQIYFRYKANLIGDIVRMLIMVVLFWFFSVALVFDDLVHKDPRSNFIFYLSSFMFLVYDGPAMWTPYNTTVEDLYNGTLESIYVNPSPRYTYYIGTTFASITWSSIIFVPFFVTMIFAAKLSVYQIVLILVIVILTLVSISFIGVIMAMSIILWKQTRSLMGIISTSWTFMTGAIIPFISLPIALQLWGFIFPITVGYDLIRHYAFGDDWVSFMDVTYQWGLLIFYIIFYFIISIRMIAKVEKYAKNKGLHLI